MIVGAAEDLPGEPASATLVKKRLGGLDELEQLLESAVNDGRYTMAVEHGRGDTPASVFAFRLQESDWPQTTESKTVTYF